MKAVVLAALLVSALAAHARADSETTDPLDAAPRAPRVAVGPLVLVGEDHPSPRERHYGHVTVRRGPFVTGITSP